MFATDDRASLKQNTVRIVKREGSQVGCMHPSYVGPADHIGIRILACLAIATSVAGYFWLYDTVAHREPIVIPGRAQSNISSESWVEPLTPDMASAAVAFANADVPAAATTQRDPEIRQDITVHKQRKMAAVPKKRRTHAAKAPIRSEVRAAYAQAPSSFGFVPLGRF
jgi:hypothetical protein